MGVGVDITALIEEMSQREVLWPGWGSRANWYRASVTCAVFANASKSALRVGTGSMRGLPAASERMEALLRKGASGKEGMRTRWCNWKAHNGRGIAAVMTRRMRGKENMGK